MRVIDTLVERFEALPSSTREKLEKMLADQWDPEKPLRDANYTALAFDETEMEAIVRAFLGKTFLESIRPFPEEFAAVAQESAGALVRVALFRKQGMRVLRFGSSTLKQKILETAGEKLKPGDIRQPFGVYYVDVDETLEDSWPLLEKKMQRYVDGVLAERYADGMMATLFSESTVWQGGAKVKLYEELHFSIGDDETIEGAVTRFLESVGNRYGGTNSEYAAIDEKAARLAIAHLIGASAYLSIYRDKTDRVAEEPPPPPSSLKKLGKRKRNAPKNRQYHYVLTEPKEASRSWERGAENARRKQSKATLVRGHWRNQPYGSTRLEKRPTKLIWIEPYWKNIDGEADGKCTSISLATEDGQRRTALMVLTRLTIRPDELCRS